MSANPVFKVGDRFRMPGQERPETVLEVNPRERAHSRMPEDYDFFVVTDHTPSGIWTKYLRDAERLPESDSEPVPDLSEYADPKHGGLIRQVGDLQAVLRRRNEKIDELRKELAQANNYASALSEAGVNNWVEGLIVVETGARFRAMGLDFDDIRRWQETEAAEESRVMRRIHLRTQREEAS